MYIYVYIYVYIYIYIYIYYIYIYIYIYIIISYQLFWSIIQLISRNQRADTVVSYSKSVDNEFISCMPPRPPHR